MVETVFFKRSTFGVRSVGRVSYGKEHDEPDIRNCGAGSADRPFKMRGIQQQSHGRIETQTIHESTAVGIVVQTTPYSALLDRVYEGFVTIGDLRQYIGIGIGTFDGLDGELVAVEGNVYQVRSHGIAYPVSDNLRTPFAVVCRFVPDRMIDVRGIDGFTLLSALLDSLRETSNMFYGIRIEGVFDHVRTKSMPRQERPYKPLVELLNSQPEFILGQVNGVAEGFYFPPYVEGINIPGYHIHFITSDRTAGGHLIDCRIHEARVSIALVDRFMMMLNRGQSEFYRADLTNSLREELSKTEQYDAYRAR